MNTMNINVCMLMGRPRVWSIFALAHAFQPLRFAPLSLVRCHRRLVALRPCQRGHAHNTTRLNQIAAGPRPLGVTISVRARPGLAPHMETCHAIYRKRKMRGDEKLGLGVLVVERSCFLDPDPRTGGVGHLAQFKTLSDIMRVMFVLLLI